MADTMFYTRDVPRSSSDYDGYRCATDERISVNSHIPTLAHCASICFVNDDCQSYFHQPNTQECSLCRIAYGINGDDAGLEEWTGSLYESRYQYIGCYDDNLPRILEDIFIKNDTMTTEMCIKRCITAGRTYALTEATDNCDCGNQLKAHGKYEDTSFPRNSSDYDGYMCATDERISVNSHISTLAHCASTCFVNDDCQSYFHQPNTQECSLCRIAYGINGDDAGLEEWIGSLYESRYRYVGCYDDYPPRILEGLFISDIIMTTEMCIKRCITEDRIYALTEAGYYCDCGHQLNPHGKYADTSCFQACAGDNSQTCGAGWTGTVYAIRHW
ncbi:uncharacterized protein LOC132729942 [Ruditapes philippinarum]|uniref:uncharacterized protein LOC132729942 n=1 Tax=Ruditapes philippinarum TaxID=129788 RepID=UPI00295A8036|nr:uncharacterized protein LOC132729942 [Ruditapes philippinarum]